MALLDNMALFVEVVKAMNFRRAAQAIGIPNSTLSRKIKELENEIGLRLLHRTTRKIELTEAGQIYFERCKRIIDEAKLAHEQLAEIVTQPSGLLRVSLPVDFATSYLSPLIAEFSHLYPNIDFELDLTPHQADLISSPVDVAIRMGELPNSGLIARQLTRLSSKLYAAPDYLQQSAPLNSPDDLQYHQCIRFTHKNNWTLSNDSQTITIPVGGRYVLNNIGMMRRLATLNQGIVLLPEAMAAQDVAKGMLCQLLPEWHSSPIPVYALTETRLLPAKIQTLITFLRDGFNPSYTVN